MNLFPISVVTLPNPWQPMAAARLHPSYGDESRQMLPDRDTQGVVRITGMLVLGVIQASQAEALFMYEATTLVTEALASGDTLEIIGVADQLEALAAEAREEANDALQSGALAAAAAKTVKSMHRQMLAHWLRGDYYKADEVLNTATIIALLCMLPEIRERDVTSYLEMMAAFHGAFMNPFETQQDDDAPQQAE